MEVLNGEEVDTIENERDDTKRSMKIMLKSKFTDIFFSNNIIEIE
jgi:hypothetical protein